MPRRTRVAEESVRIVMFQGEKVINDKALMQEFIKYANERCRTHHDLVSLQERWSDIVLGNVGSRIFFLLHNNRVVAHAEVTIADKHTRRVEYLCAQRGHGYGTRILLSIVAAYYHKERPPPINAVELTSIAEARGFYRKLGFKDPFPSHDPDRKEQCATLTLNRFRMKMLVLKHKHLIVPIEQHE